MHNFAIDVFEGDLMEIKVTFEHRTIFQTDNSYGNMFCVQVRFDTVVLCQSNNCHCVLHIKDKYRFL